MCYYGTYMHVAVSTIFGAYNELVFFLSSIVRILHILLTVLLLQLYSKQILNQMRFSKFQVFQDQWGNNPQHIATSLIF